MRFLRIPDLLTTANLACGMGAILLSSQGYLTLACWSVFLGAAFDVLDGAVARAFGGGSRFGKELDSLADMVTFGVAPGMVVFGHVGVEAPIGPDWAVYVAVLAIPIASGWRLARFNVDERSTTGFLGLPTPANALFWCAVVLGASGTGIIEGPLFQHLANAFTWILGNSIQLMVLSVMLGALMLSSIQLPSLKFSHWGWRGNAGRWQLIGGSVILLLLYGILAVPLILVLYLLSPLWTTILYKNKEQLTE